MPIVVALALLALPIAEIAGFIIVGSQIGVLATIGLILAMSVAGAMLLRVQGFGAMQRMRAAMDLGEPVGGELADSMMIMLAGLLLITPGFITGALGILLFIPPVRRLFWKLAGLKLAVVAARRGSPGPDVVDLGRDEYRREDGPGYGPGYGRGPRGRIGHDD